MRARLGHNAAPLPKLPCQQSRRKCGSARESRRANPLAAEPLSSGARAGGGEPCHLPVKYMARLADPARVKGSSYH